MELYARTRRRKPIVVCLELLSKGKSVRLMVEQERESSNELGRCQDDHEFEAEAQKCLVTGEPSALIEPLPREPQSGHVAPHQSRCSEGRREPAHRVDLRVRERE